MAAASTRILQIKQVHPQAQLLFSSRRRSGFTTLSQTPGFFRAILDWYGVDPAQVTLIHRPTLAHQLWVAPQGEQLLNIGPAPAYLDLVDEQVERRLQHRPRQKAVFVSRAGVRARFAGEEYLERIMRQAGISVIRPETLPLAEQLVEYESADHLVFSEGSALHGLQLLGRCIGHVHVLNRRRHEGPPEI